MAQITTRQTGTTGVDGVFRKNAPLTNTEIDENFISLNGAKLETSVFTQYTTNFQGNSNIVTLGSVTSGEWLASRIGTAYGGTGLSSFNSGGALYATSGTTLATGTLPSTAGGTGFSSSTGNGKLLIGNSSNTFSLNTLSGTSSRITISNGNGTITISTPQDIDTSSNVQFACLGVGTSPSSVAGEIRATNNITAYYSSDARLKENIEDIQNPLEIVCSIGSKTFDWSDEYIKNHGGEDGYFVTKSDFGVIAQDVQEVFPQAVRTREDGTLAVDYEKLSTLAFGAIKQLLARVEALESK